MRVLPYSDSDVQDVVIITGPAYLPSCSSHGCVLNIRTIGCFPNLVHVPTHFFKIILTRKCQPSGDSTTLGCAAFLVPNSDATAEPTQVSSLTYFEYFKHFVRWDYVISCILVIVFGVSGAVPEDGEPHARRGADEQPSSSSCAVGDAQLLRHVVRVSDLVRCVCSENVELGTQPQCFISFVMNDRKCWWG